MMSKTTSGFPDVHQGLQQMLPVTEYLVSPSAELNPGSGSHSSSLLFYLSILKDKHTQMQTVAGVLLSPEQNLPESTSMAISSMNSIVQEIIGIATSLMFTCQQIIALGSTTPGTATCADELHQQQSDPDHRLPHQSNFGNNRGVFSNIGPYIRGQSFFPSIEADALDWFGESCNNNNNNTNNNNSSSNNCNRKDGDRSVAISETNNSRAGLSLGDEHNEGCRVLSPKNNDIIELDVADLLAKYTHYCQVCGKGFKRDANLRMHMRAHGDEYKTSAALSNPMKNKGSSGGGSDCSMSTKPKKYSCPHEGCRWNQRHAKFQPLKSMICVKNHYKRSHCPKMYMCKRCNQKQFSVLSDLRTHEKHCGDPSARVALRFPGKTSLWVMLVCSSGTTQLSMAHKAQENLSRRHCSCRSMVVQDDVFDDRS